LSSLQVWVPLPAQALLTSWFGDAQHWFSGWNGDGLHGQPTRLMLPVPQLAPTAPPSVAPPSGVAVPPVPAPPAPPAEVEVVDGVVVVAPPAPVLAA
jgi:hypothetical protein